MSLVNKKTNNIQFVVAVPTKSGNGFIKGQEYTFEHHRNRLYRTFLDDNNFVKKYEDFGPRSAHLWDGTGDYEKVAGKFNIVDSYE